MFKPWFLRVEANRIKLDYLQIDCKEEFISTIFQNFYQKKQIKIRYISLYMHKENGIAK